MQERYAGEIISDKNVKEKCEPQERKPQKSFFLPVLWVRNSDPNNFACSEIGKNQSTEFLLNAKNVSRIFSENN